MTSGIDVSNHQGVINWNAVHDSGHTWAYTKLTEGVGYVDPRGDANLSAASAAGLLAGAYHFARPDTNSAEAEAEHFATELARNNAAGHGWLPPCLDIERAGTGDLPRWVATFIAELRKATGRREVTVYAASGWFAERLDPGCWLDDDVYLWVAHYGRPPGQPGYTTTHVIAHQYSATGRVPGVTGDVDLNHAMVDLSPLLGSNPPSEPAPPHGTVYIVQPGDTLSAIGARYDVDWQAIARANNLADPDRIYPGQRLYIPADPSEESYIVQTGDTLSGIAQRFGTTWQALAYHNNLADPNLIYPGQCLRIP